MGFGFGIPERGTLEQNERDPPTVAAAKALINAFESDDNCSRLFPFKTGNVTAVLLIDLRSGQGEAMNFAKIAADLGLDDAAMDYVFGPWLDGGDETQSRGLEGTVIALRLRAKLPSIVSKCTA